METKGMKTGMRVLSTAVCLAVLCVLAMFSLATPQSRTAFDSRKHQAIFILENNDWYTNLDLWRARGWSKSEPPELAPDAIRGIEVSELTVLISLMSPNEALSEYLEDWVHHKNKEVARLAVRTLVKRGNWTKEKALQFAHETSLSLTEEELLNVVQLESGTAKGAAVPETAKEKHFFGNAITILENPQWHIDDPTIISLRDAQERNDAEVRTSVDQYVQDREIWAINTVISSDIPAARKESLLETYLAHHNDFVSQKSLSGLVSLGLWNPERAITYVEGHSPTVDSWNELLQVIPHEGAKDSQLRAARRLLKTALKSAEVIEGESDVYKITNAVRLIGVGGKQEDAGLIESVARAYSDNVMAWVAVSRIRPRAETVAVAREVFADSEKTVAARAAAAMVFGKKNHDIMEWVVGEILIAVQKFGTREYMEEEYAILRTPPDTAAGEANLKSPDLKGLLAVAYEVPVEYLEPHIGVFVDHPYNIIGGGMCVVLARRLPDALLRTIQRKDKIPSQLEYALEIAEYYHPELAERIERLMPREAVSRLADALAVHGPEALPISKMTLWE